MPAEQSAVKAEEVESVESLKLYLAANREAMVFVRIGNGQFRLGKGEGLILVRTMTKNAGYEGWSFEVDLESGTVYIDPNQRTPASY